MIYMLKNKIIISLLLIVFVTGCGYKQTNTQIRDVAYLKFNKSLSKNYTVVINEKYEFKLGICEKQDDETECNDDNNKIYEITSGNTFIKVFDSNNDIVINKEVYIGSSTTMEVDLP